VHSLSLSLEKIEVAANRETWVCRRHRQTYIGTSNIQKHLAEKMSTQKLTCHVAHPLQFQLGYDDALISTSFGLRNMDSRENYRGFLNNIHYRNDCFYEWKRGSISHSRVGGVGVITIHAKGQQLLEFTMCDGGSYSYVERVLYRLLQVAEEMADGLVR
jgi:hypothetical protein